MRILNIWDFPNFYNFQYWRHIVELYDEAPCLGTRQLLEVHEDKQVKHWNNSEKIRIQTWSFVSRVFSLFSKDEVHKAGHFT